MEQQPLEPQLPKRSLWVDQYEDEDEDDEEEEVGVGLLARHSTNGVGASISTRGELVPLPASAPTSGTTSDHSIQEEDEAIAVDRRRTEEVVDEIEENNVLNREGGGNGNIVYSDKLQGIKSINKVSEIPKVLTMETNHSTVKHVEGENIFGLSTTLAGETAETVKHFDRAITVDTNVELIGETGEGLIELDVERVLGNQSTHDLYCPNCNSCITRKVILVRRKPKISNINHKPKHSKKLDLIPNSKGDGCSGGTPAIHANVSPTPARDEQNNGRDQEQEEEAFNCLSCFSLFIPLGNGCFKIFQSFKKRSQNEQTQSQQEVSQRENTQSSQERNEGDNNQSTQGKIQSPFKISQMEKTQRSQGISQNENTDAPQQVSDNEETQSLEKRSSKANMHIPQHIKHTENAQEPEPGISENENIETPRMVSNNESTESPKRETHKENKRNSQHINHNEDAQSPQRTIHNASKQKPQDINQNENKQSPRKMPTTSTSWTFSFSAFHKGKDTVEKVDHASLVLSASVPTQSVTSKEQIDGVAIQPKEPRISNVFSSTNSSLLDNVKAESREQKPDADMLQRNAGENEIEHLEAGLLESTLYPRTEEASLPQSRTHNESIGIDAGEAHEWEVLKSLVYGGLIESITSLGVVSSAAGAGAVTLKVLALGLANVIGGLVILSHNIRELKNDRPHGAFTEIDNEEDRYQAALGRRQNFVSHVVVAIISFLIFGLVPPVVYGFSFRNSNDNNLKLAAMGGASLVCIILLALGKAHVNKPHRTYFRTVSYYVILGILVSGISYLVGELLKKLAEQVGLIESSSAVRVPFLETVTLEAGRASY